MYLLCVFYVSYTTKYICHSIMYSHNNDNSKSLDKLEGTIDWIPVYNILVCFILFAIYV